MSMNIIEAYRKGDRVGAPFEGKTMWTDVPEERIQVALKSSRGTDESSIVNCFLAYVERRPWNGDMDSWQWGWLVYHQENHGTGYGKTYRNHFALVDYLNKRRHDCTAAEKLAKVRQISEEADSFGNACLALVYPLYLYAKANIKEMPARDVVLWFTRHTHASANAEMAVSRLMEAIDGNRIESPGEDIVRRDLCDGNATAWNTLLTAAYIADVETEEELYRRGIWVGGDVDSTMATAALLWAIKTIAGSGVGDQ